MEQKNSIYIAILVIGLVIGFMVGSIIMHSTIQPLVDDWKRLSSMWQNLTLRCMEKLGIGVNEDGSCYSK